MRQMVETSIRYLLPRVRRFHLLISAVVLSFYWGMTAYMMAASYATALYLVERNELQKSNIIM